MAPREMSPKDMKDSTRCGAVGGGGKHLWIRKHLKEKMHQRTDFGCISRVFVVKVALMHQWSYQVISRKPLNMVNINELDIT